jgi:hypothetical protein
MPNHANCLSARTLVNELIPRLKALERLVGETLGPVISRTRDGKERQRLTTLRQEFELKSLMIRMNLGHLTKRYAEEIQTATRPEGDDTLLMLDEHEAAAIASLQSLYARAQTIQTAT